MTPDRRADLEKLAALIVDDRRAAAAQNRKLPFYMLNVGHPLVLRMYTAWRTAAAAQNTPPGDIERTAWELSLLSDQALEAIKKQYNMEA